MRGQCCLPALRGAHLRGLQGVLQEDRPKECQICLSGRQELPSGQAEAEQVPVLPLPEVLGRRHGQGGCEDGRAQGAQGPPAVQA